jgi:cytochrome c-type biogenesis protein CcmF
MVGRIPEEVEDLGLKLTFANIDPAKGTFTIGVNTTQKDWIIMKAREMPYINVLWIGTLVMTIGFIIAISRRYSEFAKMRNKEEVVKVNA